ncbi:hypothetical protein ACHAPA_007653 [Fusarium lateritium]
MFTLYLTQLFLLFLLFLIITIIAHLTYISLTTIIIIRSVLDACKTFIITSSRAPSHKPSPSHHCPRHIPSPLHHQKHHDLQLYRDHLDNLLPSSHPVAVAQPKTTSRKARRHARKARSKAAAQRNIQPKSVIQPEKFFQPERFIQLESVTRPESVTSSGDESDDMEEMEEMEMRIQEKVTNTIAEQRAYWDMSVERRKATNPNYMEITHGLTDDPIIDQLMDYWED